MQIRALDRRHGGFYVPTSVVTVAGEDVLRDLYLTVTDVKVDLKEKTAGHFSFSVAGAFDWRFGEFLATRREVRVDLLELFAFGRKVEIRLGYDDVSAAQPMLTGVVTGIATDFQAGGTPVLTVTGYDDLYPLTVGKSTRQWDDKPDSVAVEAIAADHHVPADVRPTTPSKRRIDQNNETDMSFVDRLCGRNEATTFYLRDRTLYFGPRQNTARDVVELTWGEGLVGFSPEANLARQIAEVQVHGRTADTGDVVIGRARRGEEAGRDGGEESGGDRVRVLAADPVLHMRAAVHTQAEADARAKAVLNERAQQFVKGSGESVGVPEILPDTNIALTGLGRAFSKTYYVTGATHTLDGNGYRTSFTVEEPTV